MSANLHWQLRRPGRLFLSFFFLIIYTGLMPTLLVGRMEDQSVFQWFCISLPLTFGVLLTSVLHEAMHQPSILLLPGARQRFFRDQMLVLGLLTVPLVALAYLLDRTLSLVTIMGFVAAALTLPLPTEPGGRWAGSRAAFFGVLLGAFAVVAFSDKLRTFATAHPWVAGALGLGLTALHLILGFSPSRVRARALVSHTPVLSAIGDQGYTKRRAAEQLTSRGPSKRRWQPSAKRDSLAYWVSVVRYEACLGGKNYNGWLGTLLGVGFLVALGIAFPIFGRDFNIYQIVCGAGTLSGHAQFPYIVFGFLFTAQASVAPRPEWLYPLTRARRAQVAFASSWSQLATSFAAGTVVMVGAAWGYAFWHGLALNPSATWRFLVLFATMLPFIPVGYWGKMHALVRGDEAMAGVCGFISVGAACIAYVIVSAVGGISTATLALVTLFGIAMSQGLYYAALRRFYLKGDLLQRGTKRQNFSLI